ncbi:hypothetical protein [Rhodoblastus sp.]|uniref:hypothetical protein n=1 Tax=Rhodoblastus sp. TaxID=1962975 RepID=UPI003F9714AF
MSTFNFKGASSNAYVYRLTPVIEFDRLPLQAGNYILASGNAANPVPIFIAAAENIRNDVSEQMASGLWNLAQTVHNATLLYFHVDLGMNGARRQAELDDLCLYYAPPMNTDT